MGNGYSIDNLHSETPSSTVVHMRTPRGSWTTVWKR